MAEDLPVSCLASASSLFSVGMMATAVMVVVISVFLRLPLFHTTRGALSGPLCRASTGALVLVLEAVLVLVLGTVLEVMPEVMLSLPTLLLLLTLLSASLTSLCGCPTLLPFPTIVRAKTRSRLSSTLSGVPSTDGLFLVLNAVSFLLPFLSSCILLTHTVSLVPVLLIASAIVSFPSVYSLPSPLSSFSPFSSFSSLSASISMTACRAFLGQCAFLLLSLTHSSTALSASVAVPSLTLLFTAL